MASRIRSIPTHSYLYPYVTSILDEAKGHIESSIQRRNNTASARIPTAIDEWAEQQYFIPSTSQPIQLLPHQRGILRLAFTRLPDGFFPYRTFTYSTVKQSGKTTISGLILRWFTETQGRYQESYAIGNDLDQAMGRGYREAYNSIALTPGYNKSREALPGEWDCLAKTLTCLRTGSFIRALAVDATGEAGGKPAIQVWTELWGAEQKEALRFWEELTPVPTIPDSMRVIETYAGYEGESKLLKTLYDTGMSGRQLTAGEFAKRTNTPLGSFEESPNPEDPIPVWENQNASMLMYWDSGVQARRMPWQKGERGEAYYRQQEIDLVPPAFRRFHLNEWSSAESQFIHETAWDACFDPELTPLLPGDRTPLVLGVDAASTYDCFAIVAVSRHPARHDEVAVRAVRIFDPRETGGHVDYDEAERFIRRICGGYCTASAQHPATLPDPDCPDCEQRSLVPGNNVVHVAYDPYQLESMMQRLGREQVAWCSAFNQQGDRLKADKGLYDAIMQRRIWHNGDQRLKQHVLNAGAKVQKDADSTLRLVKVAPNRKIDATVAMAMAQARCQWLTL